MINIFELYDYKKYKNITNVYSGDTRKERIVRALANGDIPITEIRKLKVYGKSSCGMPDKYYRLINRIGERKDCVVIHHKSGLSFSTLHSNSLSIKNGVGEIHNFWE